MRRRWGIGALAFVLLALAGPARAARLPPDVEVRAGLSDVIDGDRVLVPVVVTLRNKFLPTEGRIEITVPDHGDRSEVRYVQTLSLPAPSTKTCTLWVRAEPHRELQVSVTFEDHFRPFRKRLVTGSSHSLPVACLEVPAAYRKADLLKHYRFIELAPSAMPDDLLAFSGWHAVMLSRHAQENLGGPAREALRRWVVTGGTLIGTDLPCEALLAQAGLLSPETVAHLTAPAATAAGVRRPARPLAVPAGAGLVAGNGGLPSATPFWEGDSNLVARLFPAAGDPEDVGSYNTSGHLGDLCRNQRGTTALGFLWVLLIVAAYGAAIGPLDRWITARAGRPQLTWFLFPAAILAFSLVAYGYSRLVNVGTMRAVTLHVVDAAPGHGVARGETLAWVYAARNATYPFESALDGACLSARETSLGASTVAGVEIRGGRHATLTARIPVFSAKEFDASWYIPWTNAVSCRETASGLAVVLPPGLDVTAAWIADTNGVVELTRSERSRGEWVGNGSRLSLEMLLGKADDFPQRYGRRSDSRAAAGGDRLPQRLRDYLLLLSLPGPRLAEGESDDHRSEGRDFVESRDAREVSLDLRPRLARGPVLLLFVEGLVPSPFRSLRFEPEAREITLVRLPLTLTPAADRRLEGE